MHTNPDVTDRQQHRTRRELVKVSLNLSPSDIASVEALAGSLSTTKTDVIRRALSLYTFVQDALMEGSKILIERSDGQLERLVTH